jgi:hypothetical protein
VQFILKSYSFLLELIGNGLHQCLGHNRFYHSPSQPENGSSWSEQMTTESDWQCPWIKLTDSRITKATITTVDSLKNDD